MLGESISSFKCIHIAFYNTLCMGSTSVWVQLVMRELNVYARNIIYICIVLEPPKKYIDFFTSHSQAFTSPRSHCSTNLRGG